MHVLNDILRDVLFHNNCQKCVEKNLFYCPVMKMVAVPAQLSGVQCVRAMQPQRLTLANGGSSVCALPDCQAGVAVWMSAGGWFLQQRCHCCSLRYRCFGGGWVHLGGVWLAILLICWPATAAARWSTSGLDAAHLACPAAILLAAHCRAMLMHWLHPCWRDS